VASAEPPVLPPVQPAGRRSPKRRLAIAGAIRRWLPFAIGLAIGVVLSGGILIYMRANRALTTIEQADPRLQLTATPNKPSGGLGGVIGGVLGGDLYPTQAPLPNALQQPVNILLIGVDKRPSADEGVRSDTLILVHLDPQAKWASMLSIPRDSVVSIPHLGRAKINTAYSQGYMSATAIYGEGTAPDAAGAALAAETVENFLKVNVDYTAQVDFHGFEVLIDTIGGVLLDVPLPLLDAEFPTEDYGVERIYVPAGLQVMNGHTALVYARSRHASTDFDRSKRQQMVLRALLEQVRARGLLENLTALPEWTTLLEQNVRTTLPISNYGMVNGLATLARELKSDRVVQLSINPLDVAIDLEDGSDIYWNKSDLAALVARWQAGPDAAKAGRIQVINGAAVAGIAGRVSDYLISKGFALNDPGQAAQVYEHTTIIDYTGHAETRQRLAELLGIPARYVEAPPAEGAPPRPTQTDILLIVGEDYQQRWMGE
jgi:polyisoprenyl-teichoic acid--peptidoglycan teichoic acid transferase